MLTRSVGNAHHAQLGRNIDLRSGGIGEIQGIEGGLDAAVEDGRTAVSARLARLEREWDVDRALLAGLFVTGGLALATGVAERRLGKGQRLRQLLSGLQIAAVALRASLGIGPFARVLGRVGLRTRRQIDVERRALLASLATPRG